MVTGQTLHLRISLISPLIFRELTADHEEMAAESRILCAGYLARLPDIF